MSPESRRAGARVLVVEPSVAVGGTVRRYLESAGLAVRVVPYLDEAVQRCLDAEADLLFASCSSAFDGETLCAKLKQVLPRLPVALFYPPEVDDPSVSAMRVGADAYLVGPLKRGTLLSTARLLLRLSKLTEESSPVEPLVPPEWSGEANAQQGDLRFFKRAVVMELRRAQRYPAPVSLLMVGYDQGEKLLGEHPIGGPFFAQTQRALGEALRDVDVVARLADGRFLVLLPQTSPEGATAVAARLKDRIGSPTEWDGLTVSVGVCAYQPREGDSRLGLSAMIKLAHQALVKARQAGGNRVEAAGGGRARRNRISLA